MGGAFLPIMAQRRTMSFPQAPNTYTPHPLTGIIEGQHKRCIYIYIYIMHYAYLYSRAECGDYIHHLGSQYS